MFGIQIMAWVLVWKHPNFSRKLKYHLNSQPFSLYFRWSIFKSRYKMQTIKKSSFQIISFFGCPEFGQDRIEGSLHARSTQLIFPSILLFRTCGNTALKVLVSLIVSRFGGANLRFLTTSRVIENYTITIRIPIQFWISEYHFRFLNIGSVSGYQMMQVFNVIWIPE